MIIDHISQLEKYSSLNPCIPQVIAFLQSHPLQEIPPQTYLINGEEAYINIQTAQGRSPEEALLESHRRMMDIQLPIEEEEIFGYCPVNLLAPAPYDEEHDICFYDGQKPLSYITCKPGMFAIFLPNDAHAPCISTRKAFKKAVIKLAV